MGMNVYYFVQCHGDGGNVVPLARFLAGKDTEVLIFADCIPPVVRDIASQLDDLQRVKVLRSPNVTWCGWSQVEAMMLGLRLFFDSKGDVFVNLTGTCVPLSTRPKIAKTISRFACHPKVAMCAHFQPPALEPIFTGAATFEYECIAWESRGLTIHVDRAARQHFASIEESPVIFADRRASFWAAELSSQKAIQIDVPSAEQCSLMELARSRYVIGRAYFVISRFVAKEVLDRVSRPGWWQSFRNLFEPDEAFLPSLLFDIAHYGPESSRCEFISRNLHFGYGEPGAQIMSAPLEKLKTSGALFGRKYRRGVNPQLDAYLESIGFGAESQKARGKSLSRFYKFGAKDL